MAAKKTAAPAAPLYDSAKRYAITLSRVVQHDGFVIRPATPAPEVSGELANLIADAISEARELAPLAAPAAPPAQVHESAEGVQTVVNAA